MDIRNENLQKILDAFGLTFQKVTAFSDTSRAPHDKRLNFILDDRYVLKIHSAQSMWEARLQQIQRLIDRYNAIGVYCPRLLPASSGALSAAYDLDGVPCTCFVEEYAAYPVCNDDVVLDRREVITHIGRLAATYTDVDLSEICNMWSIIDLAPLDIPYGIDEKQANADMLAKALAAAGSPELSQQVLAYNERLRREIRKDFRRLPRCVYQGDLNSGNYLHKDGHFAGLIDFNLSGTDVNINEFVNETDHFPETEEFDSMSVPEILKKMADAQDALLSVILSQYPLNDLEQRLLPYFKGITGLFQYPNVCLMCRWLEDGARRDKCTALIEALIQTV